MKTQRTPLVVGNWKMHPSTLAEARRLVVQLRTLARKFSPAVTVVVAPPTVYLADLVRLSPSGRIQFGVQNIWPGSTGAQTGEESVPMVSSCGASYVIIGHSERRANGETDEQVAAKYQAVVAGKLTPIVCVGERTRDASGDYYAVVETQLRQALVGAKKAQVKRTVIAYEPVWAIGTGQTPTAADIEEMRLFIDKCLTKLFDRATARSVQVLYGGSVSDQNAAELFTQGGVDGFLVGGASLRPTEFARIVASVV